MAATATEIDAAINAVLQRLKVNIRLKSEQHSAFLFFDGRLF